MDTFGAPDHLHPWIPPRDPQHPLNIVPLSPTPALPLDTVVTEPSYLFYPVRWDTADDPILCGLTWTTSVSSYNISVPSWFPTWKSHPSLVLIPKFYSWHGPAVTQKYSNFNPISKTAIAMIRECRMEARCRFDLVNFVVSNHRYLPIEAER